MAESFKVEVREDSRGTVVTVWGELDVASSGTLEQELDQLVDVPLVVVDLRSVAFIDSTGLGILVRAHQHALARDHRVAFVRGDGQVERLLSLTGLDAQLLVGDSAEELLSRF